ncbi:MAG: PaaI family thioesterase, partial [Halioglobus sp.]|nr:PaaI family thioesterase [Halioglobus sp.]
MVTKDALEAFFAREFPQAQFTIESVGRRSASICRTVSERDLRPGGTVSGPTLMELADTALYVAILGEIGLVALAVTTNLNINFLRKPSPDRNL